MNIANATTYAYELSEDQPWSDGGSTITSTEYVTVRTYVPGSNSITYGTVPIYTPNSVLLTSGKILWFSTETIIKYNDASAFQAGQTLEFKAWKNPDGSLIGIKVEVA